MLRKLKGLVLLVLRLGIFILAIVLIAPVVLGIALIVRDDQLRPVFFLSIGLLLLVMGFFGVGVSMRQGHLVEVGLGVMATSIGTLFLLIAQPWQMLGF